MEVRIESRNRPYTAVALQWAIANGATCIDRGQGLYVCGSTEGRQLHSFADGPRGGVTIGNVFITEEDPYDTLDDPDLLAHEAKHSDQWAIGGKWIPGLYWGSELAAGLVGVCGPFEVAAGAKEGC
jgi:hypothetical protein